MVSGVLVRTLESHTLSFNLNGLIVLYIVSWCFLLISGVDNENFCKTCVPLYSFIRLFRNISFIHLLICCCFDLFREKTRSVWLVTWQVQTHLYRWVWVSIPFIHFIPDGEWQVSPVLEEYTTKYLGIIEECKNKSLACQFGKWAWRSVQCQFGKKLIPKSTELGKKQHFQQVRMFYHELRVHCTFIM